MTSTRSAANWIAARSTPLLILFACVTTSCSVLADPQVIRSPMIATIDFYNDPIVVHTPDSVRVGNVFPVTVRSYGGGCITQGHTDVTINGLGAVVTPYDTVVTRAPENYACTMELRHYEHVAHLAFDRPGSAAIRFQGRREPGGTIISVSRTVVVW